LAWPLKSLLLALAGKQLLLLLRPQEMRQVAHHLPYP
jgi:hypothetical protein